VCDAARMNAQRGTGGPFGTVEFERATGKMLTVRENRVVQETVSSSRGELRAVSLARQARDT
jgi:hypothetical protein